MNGLAEKGGSLADNALVLTDKRARLADKHLILADKKGKSIKLASFMQKRKSSRMLSFI
jgi:hypothetical protein